jgi:DNA-binding CsgD family transcriptional regulator
VPQDGRSLHVQPAGWVVSGGFEAVKVHTPLTPPELRVLLLVAAGQGNRQIAEELLLSEDTVKTHLRRICRKMRARNRTHAVTVAFAPGGWVIAPNILDVPAGVRPLFVDVTDARPTPTEPPDPTPRPISETFVLQSRYV